MLKSINEGNVATYKQTTGNLWCKSKDMKILTEFPIQNIGSAREKNRHNLIVTLLTHKNSFCYNCLVYLCIHSAPRGV